MTDGGDEDLIELIVLDREHVGLDKVSEEFPQVSS
jgi:hypothetical protein